MLSHEGLIKDISLISMLTVDYVNNILLSVIILVVKYMLQPSDHLGTVSDAFYTHQKMQPVQHTRNAVMDPVFVENRIHYALKVQKQSCVQSRLFMLSRKLLGPTTWCFQSKGYTYRRFTLVAVV